MGSVIAVGVIVIVALIITIGFGSRVLGLVTIRENQVGIIIRKFGKSLPPGDGEGYEI